MAEAGLPHSYLQSLRRGLELPRAAAADAEAAPREAEDGLPGYSWQASPLATLSLEPGLTDAEISDIEQRHGIRLPPDLRSLLQFMVPVGGLFVNWRNDDQLRDALETPLARLADDVDSGYWWPEWGRRPATLDDAIAVMRGHVLRMPRLLPVYGHRFIPDAPHESGNPVFSTYGFDTIVYGNDLADYFAREFRSLVRRPTWAAGRPKTIEFWSALDAIDDAALRSMNVGPFPG